MANNPALHVVKIKEKSPQRTGYNPTEFTRIRQNPRDNRSPSGKPRETKRSIAFTDGTGNVHGKTGTGLPNRRTADSGMKQKRRFADVVAALIHTQGDEKHALPTRKSVVIVER